MKPEKPRFRMPMRYIGKTKLIEAIKNAHNRWQQCLKEANGDLEKARELYDGK